MVNGTLLKFFKFVTQHLLKVKVLKIQLNIFIVYNFKSILSGTLSNLKKTLN